MGSPGVGWGSAQHAAGRGPLCLAPVAVCFRLFGRRAARAYFALGDQALFCGSKGGIGISS